MMRSWGAIESTHTRIVLVPTPFDVSVTSTVSSVGTESANCVSTPLSGRVTFANVATLGKLDGQTGESRLDAIRSLVALIRDVVERFPPGGRHNKTVERAGLGLALGLLLPSAVILRPVLRR